MRVLQLIDSLRPGGAEKMAVTYANSLVRRIDGSYLCCTRIEGLLKPQLFPEVGYLFLNKKSSLDLQAFKKLRRFVVENKIDLIQAHSSSWFFALMIKKSLPNVRLVWHDHFGKELSQRKPGLLKPASRLFDGIIVVNSDLQIWAQQKLYCRNVNLYRNFLPDKAPREDNVELKGGDNFKIICVANFRPQKDHLTLLRAFVEVLEIYPKVTLHLLGKDDQDNYSQEIKKFLCNHKLSNVFLYGEQVNILKFLKQADLGVLSSTSEGLPVALLEYAFAGLPVVCTQVGQCEEVMGKDGKIVPPKSSEALAKGIKTYIENWHHRKKDAHAFQKRIKSTYSEAVIMPQVLKFLIRICNTT